MPESNLLTHDDCQTTPNCCLLCTDLDRTLLPNGEQLESANARPYFRTLVSKAQLPLAYVSGRDLALVQQAINEYQLPLPDYAITDVGSMIYQRVGDDYQPLPEWIEHLRALWQGIDAEALAQELGSFKQLELQASARQKPFKLSYQVTPASALAAEVSELQRRLELLPYAVNIVSSIDETQNEGLVDVLPANAGKRAAIDFLVAKLKLTTEQVFFSGDSGNDLDVLVSPYPAVVVRNALADVVHQAMTLSKINGVDEQLWVAQGDESLSLNGNYSAGIVEGLLYFYPQLRSWLTVEQESR